MNSNDIYSILSSIPHNTHYLNRYQQFLQNCDIKNHLTCPTIVEHHHILPKSIWPQYTSLYKNKWNNVSLTPRQHFIAHIILSRCFGGKMHTALYMMCKTSNDKDYKVTNRVYEKVRLALTGKNHRSHIKKIYKFKNLQTGEIRNCTRYDLCLDEDIHKENMRSLVIGKSKIANGWCVWVDKINDWSNNKTQYKYAKGLDAPCVDHKLYKFKNIKNNKEYNLTRIEMVKKSGLNTHEIGRLVRGTTRLVRDWTIWYPDQSIWANTLTKSRKGKSSPSSDKTKYNFKHSESGMEICCTRVELIELDPSTTPTGIYNLVHNKLNTHKGWMII